MPLNKHEQPVHGTILTEKPEHLTEERLLRFSHYQSVFTRITGLSSNLKDYK